MKGVLYAKLKLFFRKPWIFLIMTGMSIGFVLLMGTGDMGKIFVPVYIEEDVKHDVLIEELDTATTFSFKETNKEWLYEQITSGKAETGVILKEDHYQIIEGVASPYTPLLNKVVQKAYQKKLEQDMLLSVGKPNEREKLKEDLNHKENASPFLIEYKSLRSENSWVYNDQLHKIFGMTLFFVIYTIAYSVANIMVEKNVGIWDRIILSPVKKSEMYLGNLVYSFCLGYFQVVLIFTLFYYVFDVDFNGTFTLLLLLLIPYMFTIVALAMLLTSVVKNIQQFNAALPFIAVAMAMIGGAFWPIELVESKILLTLSHAMPIKYGMDMLHGVAVYKYPLNELLKPVSKLLVMGVFMMGIGIRLMEKRQVQ